MILFFANTPAGSIHKGITALYLFKQDGCKVKLFFDLLGNCLNVLRLCIADHVNEDIVSFYGAVIRVCAVG